MVSLGGGDRKGALSLSWNFTRDLRRSALAVFVGKNPGCVRWAPSGVDLPAAVGGRAAPRQTARRVGQRFPWWRRAVRGGGGDGRPRFWDRGTAVSFAGGPRLKLSTVFFRGAFHAGREFAAGDVLWGHASLWD